ncbi:hypothetical protein QOK74_08350 [Staphylococcus saprophyticus]|uniref:hypothetical protein n=1 Tax=Staphylococcus saprophyticus TaxID=29385 RepID=UPI0024C3CB96|nr:hypothetical protein [Staphylococcus saprophyticus]MDK1672882.1 hypothetical protein [Staphylococcus saprophyticus]
MTKYIILESNDPMKESESIIDVLSQWIDFEITNINNNILHDEYFQDDKELGYKVINELTEYQKGLVEKDGQKQFNEILNIINKWDNIDQFELQYKEL